jgi:uncharacterized protein
MATDLGTSLEALIGNESLLKSINTQKYVNDQIGVLALNDIIKELQKPGLDPRSELEQFEFANIYSMEEVTVGLILPGVVTNLTRFGAFIDIGVKQDGLVHVSEIANRYISDPSEALKLGQKVQVKVLEVDLSRKRIALSIKQTEAAPTAGIGGRKDFNQYKRSNQPIKKEEDLSNLNVTDALQALKKKFGK